MTKLISIPLAVLLIGFISLDASAQGNRGQGKQKQRLQNGKSNQSGRFAQGRNNSKGDQNQKSKGKSNRGNNSNSTANALASIEQQGLMILREEEKLARDVYLALHQQWGEQVFSNIARAESQHMAAVGNLLSRYSIPDPIANNTPGVFPSARFRNLYLSMVQAGSASRIDALKVGLKIEEMDIADLRASARQTNNNDIKQVLGNLERGSQNHLRAFAARLKAAGGTYVATHLSQNEFNQIASSQGQGPRGVGQGNGQQGNGKGQQGAGQGQQGAGKGKAGGGGGQSAKGKQKGRGR